MIGSPIVDEEVVTLFQTLERGQWLPHEVAHIRRQIQERKEQLAAGLADPTAAAWTRTLRQEIDPLLRMRFDFKSGYVLDRWVKEWSYWATVGVLGFQKIRLDLCDYLRSRDMQRIGAERYLRLKREEAAKVCAANEKAATLKVEAAVDSLSEKRIQNFIAVERARHTGETLVHHGPDLKFVEHVEELQKSAGYRPPPEDMGEHCANPGMNPNVYKRKTGGKHIRE